MKKVKTKININKEPIHLRVKVAIGSDVVIDEKANSLTYWFLRWIGAGFNEFNWDVVGKNVDRNNDTTLANRTSERLMLASPAGQGFTSLPNGLTILPKDNIINWDGEWLRISHTNNTYFRAFYRTGDYLSILSNQGNEGTYEIEDINIVSTTSVEYKLKDFTPVGTITDDEVRILTSHVPETSNYAGRIHSITIGNSTKPSSIFDGSLYGEFDTDVFSRANSAWDMTITGPVRTGGDTSTFNITQVFTNVTETAQEINEIGLYLGRATTSPSTSLFWRFKDANDLSTLESWNLSSSQLNRPQCAVMIARDVLSSTRVVAPNETISVTYQFIINTTEEYGMMGEFNELMNRCFRQIARPLTTNLNIVSNTTPNTELFASLRPLPDTVTRDRSWIGIQLGNATDGIDIDNFRLQDAGGSHTRIPSGMGSGSLNVLDATYYSGSNIISDSEAEIVLERYWINESSGSVDVNELGFNVAANFDSLPVLISRAILPISARVTVQPGEVLKAQYIFAISGSSGS